MHSCKETKEQITERLLDGAHCRPEEELAAELRTCAECRNEFEALSATLRITARSLKLSAPADDYWTTYHAKLRHKLVNVNAISESHGPSLLARFFRFSIPVPAPVALALVIAGAILIPVGIRAARKGSAQPPAVVRVEVPVVQEKIVTQVVYRNRPSPTQISKRYASPTIESTFAKSRGREVPTAFVGFKPAEDVKLTVIKGGSGNEK